MALSKSSMDPTLLSVGLKHLAAALSCQGVAEGTVAVDVGDMGGRPSRDEGGRDTGGTTNRIGSSSVATDDS